MQPAAAAGTWYLGDRTVNRLGLGVMRLPGRTALVDSGAGDAAQARVVLRRAIELGVDHLDTAAFYFSSALSANELIRSTLSPYPAQLTIVTKVGPSRTARGEWQPWARPEQLRGQVEENLRQLDVDCLDVVNLRSQGAPSLEEHFGALARLRDAGLVHHLGLSNVGAEQLAQCQQIAPVVCVQNRYSIDSQRPGSADLLRVCGEQGIAFVPFFTIAGRGREAGSTSEDSDVVRLVAGRHAATPAQVRLAWTLRLGEHVLAIPGTGDPEHLSQNVAAAALQLTDEDVALLGQQ